MAIVRLPAVGYNTARFVDPAPAYPADTVLFEAVLNAAAAAFPVSARAIEAFVLPWDVLDRYNATTGSSILWYDKDKPEGAEPPWVAQITVAGKRVPPHPAMVRYLAAHEYGHVVAHHIAYSLAGRVKDNTEAALYEEYVKVRGLAHGRDEREDGMWWHEEPAEVFACDFRVLVAKVESDYWPHPGIPHPDVVAGLDDWWRERVAEAARTSGGPAQASGA